MILKRRQRSSLTHSVMLVGTLALLLVPQGSKCKSALYNTTAARAETKLNVHIFSHTHNDPGWLHTYAQYHRALDLDGHTFGECYAAAGWEGLTHACLSDLQ